MRNKTLTHVADDQALIDAGVLAALVESFEDAVLSKTPEGVITSWNRGAQRLYGYSAPEAIGQPIALLVPPERRDEELALLARVRNGETVAAFESERVCKDGSRLAVSVQLSPIRTPDGRIVGISTIARDITQRKHIEQERHHILTSLGCLLWSAQVRGVSDEGFVQVETSFPDQEATEGFLSIARTEGEPFYQDWYRARLPEDMQSCNKRGVAALRAGQDYSQQFRIRLADGSIRWLHEDIKVQVIEPGQHWRLVGLCTDVTVILETQSHVDQLQAQAQERELTLAAANQVAQEVLTSQSGLEALRSITEAARSLAGARYAALGVARPGTTELMEFITVGLSQEQEARIGPRPSGLGVLLRRKEPLRVDDLSQHPGSVGFPPHHPPMQSFLGVPILQGDTILGSLYLTDKQQSAGNSQEAAFSQADEAAVAALGAILLTARIARLHLTRLDAPVEVLSVRSRLQRLAGGLVPQTILCLGFGADSALAHSLALKGTPHAGAR